ncbi:MAG: leucyl aminopeptidase [Pirellulaceae bacterium]|jgi:leucyl aminopeptidase
MDLRSTTQSILEIEADAVVVGIVEGQPLTGAAAALDDAIGGAISSLIESDEIRGNACELTAILAPQGIAAKQVLVVGFGKPESINASSAFKAGSAAAKRLATRTRNNLVFALSDVLGDELIEAAVCGSLVGSSSQSLYQSDPKMSEPKAVTWTNVGDDVLSAARAISDGVLITRRLVNEPPNMIYPVSFAEAAEEAVKNRDIEIEIWDKEKLQSESCGSLLGVAQGSVKEPRLVILKYNGGEPTQKPIALVGKGVTFDSGGLSLKPSEGMKTMKCDMAGAATALGAIQAIADLKLPINVIALCGLVENMPSASAFRLGDVLTAKNGKTIEVLNTDAEGRLVLADTLCVANEMGAERIIDLATLTGACVVALGLDVVGLMTNDQKWCDEVLSAAATSGELAWQLPMFSEFNDNIKSGVADIRNIGEGRWGGAITAAKFLEEFVGDTPWVHIDIAGPSFLDSPKAWCDGGGTGTMVRTLVEVARQSAAN